MLGFREGARNLGMRDWMVGTEERISCVDGGRWMEGNLRRVRVEESVI